MMNTLNTENPIEKPFRKTGDPVDLTSESPLHPRRKSRRIMVGPVPVGGGAPRLPVKRSWLTPLPGS